MAKRSAVRRGTGVLLLLGLSVAAPSWAQEAPPATGPETWNRRLQESERLLVAGESAAALEVTAPLLAEVGGQLLAGERSNAVLGSLFAMQALAEAGTGSEDLASWHWSLAQSLKPALSTTNLERYGEAGAFLEQRKRTSAEEACVDAPIERLGPEASGDFEPPQKVSTPDPEYNDEMRRVGLEGRVLIDVVLDREGKLRCPRIAEADQPAFAYLASEAVRQWLFRPARFRGRPLATPYRLTIAFGL